MGLAYIKDWEVERRVVLPGEVDMTYRDKWHQVKV
jgi:hypothetical protein